jgi:uncharacterized protein HemY
MTAYEMGQKDVLRSLKSLVDQGLITKEIAEMLENEVYDGISG